MARRRIRSVFRSSSSVIIAMLLLFCLFASEQALAGTGAVSYTYDALGRVTTVTYDTGVIVIYTYDANGNRTQQVINVNTSTMYWNSTNPCTNNCWGFGNWQGP